MKNKILLIIGLIILTSLTGCKGKETLEKINNMHKVSHF